MRELFAGNAVGGKSIDEMREELQKNHGDWYNKDHEYSCLFEHRFDLPSQRRAFVEEEVGGKFPSYLMKGERTCESHSRKMPRSFL